MKSFQQNFRSGFSLIETVIAIGVLSVLLTGFMIVFAPAAAGIRKSLNSQDAARLVATLEEELVTLRGATEVSEYATGFDKAFEFIRGSGGASLDDAILIYKYRGSLATTRADGTPEPVKVVGSQIPGVDYVVRSMMRRKGDPAFFEDLASVEGQVYMVRCTQLIMDATADRLVLDSPGKITNPSAQGTAVANADGYEDAVITFVADFYACPGKAEAYFNGAFSELFSTNTKPMFSRNLAVRR